MKRVALVTGGTRGIGAEISRALHKHGRTVIASYAGNEAAASAFAAETGIAVMRFDAGDFAACQDAVTRISGDQGPIEILVNNAGITRDGTMSRMSRDMWGRGDSIPISDPASTCASSPSTACAPRSSAASSTSAASTDRPANTARSTTPPPNPASTASPRPSRRKVHGSASPSTRSPRAMSIPTWCGRYLMMCCRRSLPGSRRDGWGRPRTVARGVVFLTADEADFVTGSTLSINGGQHMY